MGYRMRDCTDGSKPKGNKVYVCIMMWALFACSTVSPHENFKNALYGEKGWPVRIGQSIDNVGRGSFPDVKALVGIKPLDNGNSEYRYRFRGTCRYMYEVNPTTRKIVRAYFEGSEADCVLTP
jgi:hypothetical protein